MAGVTAGVGGERHSSHAAAALWLAALIPGDPLATAARRIQDSLASSGLSVAHALPPLVPVAAFGRESEVSIAPQVSTVLAALHDACFAEDLDIIATPRADALTGNASQGDAPPALRTRVVLPLAQTGVLWDASQRVSASATGHGAVGGPDEAFGTADALLLAPGTLGRGPERAVGYVRAGKLADGTGAQGKRPVITSRRWQAALLSIEYAMWGGVTSWAWQLVGSRKLRRWREPPGETAARR